MRNGDLFIPQKMWVKSEKRFLSFEEMGKVDMFYAYDSNCRRDGIELVHNSSDEIVSVVMEMNQRLDGSWQPEGDDEALQNRFRDILFSFHHQRSYGLPVRVGAEFLRQNVELLN